MYLNEEGVMLLTTEEENWVAANQPNKPVVDLEQYDKHVESLRIDFLMDIQASLSIEGRKELHRRIADELGLIESSFADDVKPA